MKIKKSKQGPAFALRMKRLRRRRWGLWGLLTGYVPLIWISLELSGSDKTTLKVFAAWVLILFIQVLRLALIRCPRCENPFHLQGCIPLYLRRCLHCGLHVSAVRAEEPSGKKCCSNKMSSTVEDRNMESI